jgi:7,8-dihydropterin-6-yl-methyl-4-(beta-D-ribofuranosyl)aminobenzene 5'-phosphate synthase
MRLHVAVAAFLLPAWMGGGAARAAPAAGPVEIQIVYDNTSTRSDLEADWGFAALVSAGGHRVLLDTGANAGIFMANLRAMGVKPSLIEHLVISHEHGDHTAGIEPLLKANAGIQLHRPRLGQGPFQVAPGIWATGALPGPPAEQALVVETPKGLVVITGCSHPGVVALVEAAEKQRNVNSVRLLAGGYHLLNTDTGGIQAIIGRLKQLNVAQAVATHCSGDLAIRMFREAFGPGPGAGVGKKIVLE